MFVIFLFLPYVPDQPFLDLQVQLSVLLYSAVVSETVVPDDQSLLFPGLLQLLPHLSKIVLLLFPDFSHLLLPGHELV